MRVVALVAFSACSVYRALRIVCAMTQTVKTVTLDVDAPDSTVNVLLDDMVRQQYGVPMVSARHRSLVGAHGKVLQLMLTAEPRGKGG